jgi:hypothetical protein
VERQAAVDTLIEGSQLGGFQLAQLAEPLDGGAVPDDRMDAIGVKGLVESTHKEVKARFHHSGPAVTDLRCRSSHSSSVTLNAALQYRLMRAAI